MNNNIFIELIFGKNETNYTITSNYFGYTKEDLKNLFVERKNRGLNPPNLEEDVMIDVKCTPMIIPNPDNIDYIDYSDNMNYKFIVRFQNGMVATSYNKLMYSHAKYL